MQTAIDQLATKQVHEDPRRAEEDYRAQNQPAVKYRVDQAVLIEVFPLINRWINDCENQQRQEGQQRDQVDQNRAASEKILLDLKTKDRADLPKPQTPVRRRFLRFSLNCLYRRTHFT